ncbi:MAG: beta-propeller fold lactonase family protein [Bradymonadales bacterium]|nr:beta-propeller fold lactonase family protein [Bradymonadales bacterium]
MKLDRALAVLGTIALLGSGIVACQEFQGVLAPADRLFFPVGIAVHPEGRYLYVVSSNFDVSYRHDRGGTVAVVDTDVLEILPETTMTIGSFGSQTVLSEDARRLYVAVRGDDSVVRLNVSASGRSLRCEERLDGLPCRLTNLAADPVALVVDQFEADLEVGGLTAIELIVTSHLQSAAISAISIKNGDPSTEVRLSTDLIAGGSAIAINPRNGYYYAVGRFSGQIRSFWPVVGREGDIAAIYGLGSVSLSNPLGTYDARDIVFAPDGNRAFVAVRNPNAILVIDTSPSDPLYGGGSRDLLIDQIDLAKTPTALAYVEDELGPALYVAEYGADQLTVVDPDNCLVVDHFEVGDGPSRMAVDQTRHQRIYVTLFNEDAVAVVDIDPNSPTYRSTVAKIQ